MKRMVIALIALVAVSTVTHAAQTETVLDGVPGIVLLSDAEMVEVQGANPVAHLLRAITLHMVVRQDLGVTWGVVWNNIFAPGTIPGAGSMYSVGLLWNQLQNIAGALGARW